MLAAPAVLWWTARPAPPGAYPVPEDGACPDILRRHDRVLAAWADAGGAPERAVA